MSNILVNTKKEYKGSIRKLKIDNKLIGGENGLPFIHSETDNSVKPLIAVEVLVNIPANFSTVLKLAWGDVINDSVEWAKAAQQKEADVLAIRFNINEDGDIDAKIANCQEVLKQILEIANIPVFILG